MSQLIKSSSLKDLVQQDVVKSRLKEIMGDRAPQFAAALVQIVNQSSQLQKCQPNSVIGCAIMAAVLDLSIDPNLGESYIVPYGDKAQFQIGYIGLTQLALRSGQYRNLGWKVIHKGELVHYDELSGELEVNDEHPDDEVIGYAAKFKLLNGFERGIYWTKERCMKHAEKFSKAYRAGLNDASKRAYSVWWQDPDRACLKTVIKMLVKLWGPKSIQMQKALKVDDGAIIDADSGEVEFLDTAPVASSPEFAEAEVVSEPVATKAPVKEKAEPKAYNKVKAIRGMMANDKLEEPAVLAFLKEVAGVDDAVTKLEEIPADTIDMLESQFNDIASRIKGGSQ
jgi:recombination protein RecT